MVLVPGLNDPELCATVGAKVTTQHWYRMGTMAQRCGYRLFLAGSLASAIAFAGACARGDRSATTVPVWTVDAAPIFDIAATHADGTVAFLYADGATMLSSGNVVVADAFDASLRVFNERGKALRKVGRRGSGPGEFEGLGWIQQCGADTVFVWDHLQGKISVIDTAGAFVRQYPERANTYDLACSRGGRVVGMTMPPITGPPNPKGETYQAPLWLADTGGKVVRRLGLVNWGQNRPLGRLTDIAASDDRIYVGTADSAFVDVYDLTGRRLNPLPVGVGVRKASKTNYEHAIDGLVGPMPTREMRESGRQQMLRIPAPEYLPVYSTVHTDPSGTLWVNVSAPGDPTTVLRAISSDGRLLGEVSVPKGLRVFEVGADYVLGRYHDSDGEQHVTAYRFVHNG